MNIICLTCVTEGVGQREGEGGETEDLQYIEQQVPGIELSPKLEPLLIEHCHHQRMLQETLTLVFYLYGNVSGV